MAATTLSYQFFVTYSYIKTNVAATNPERVNRYFLYNNPNPLIDKPTLVTALQAEILTNDGNAELAGSLVILSIEDLNDSFGNKSAANTANFRIVDFSNTTISGAISDYGVWAAANPTMTVVSAVPYYDNNRPTKINILVTFLSPT